ncbi:Gx transporter family protein [Hathewaya histolytica]|uniref:Gx transporter family protein n=1 Tax=Hathewaya histolytica TaxID=1498 RepID=UPI003B670B2A
MKNTKKLLYLGFCIGIALVIYFVEAQIPVLFPGIKLGLANSVSLFVLFFFGWKEAIAVMIIRTFLGSLFGGNLFAFFFSLSGGLFSNIVTIIALKYFKEDVSIEWLSVLGAVFHNIGQLLIAAFLIRDFRIYFYFPILNISSIITGYFTGIVTKNLYLRLNKIKHIK